MRLSVDKDDLGFNLKLARKAKAFCDGVYVPRCITADEELGYIKIHETDNGQILINEDRTGTLKGEYWGKVEIIIEEERK